MGRIVGLLTIVPFAVAACAQPATTQIASASPSASPIVTASPRLSASAAASAANPKPIELHVVMPEDGADAGLNGIGWTVDVIAKGSGPALEKVKPAIRGGGHTGQHPNFPGLVILLKSASQGGNPNANLAGLFQIIGLPETLRPLAGISSVTTSASTRASSAEDRTAQATWFVDQTMWGTDVDVELSAFIVEGEAPDTVTDRSALKIVSNEVTVRFHINGGVVVPFKPSPSPSSTP